MIRLTKSRLETAPLTRSVLRISGHSPRHCPLDGGDTTKTQEESMARMKQRRSRKTRGRKIDSRRMNASGASGKRRPGAAGVRAKRRGAQTPTVRVAAARVLVSAGRLAKDLALVGAQSAANAGRRVVARG